MSRRRRRATFMQGAIDQWRACRDEFEEYRFAAYQFAEEDCRGSLLNDRGRKARIEPLSLFMGNERRAHAYASEELIEHWARYPRPVFERFESQTVNNLRFEYAS